MWKMSSFYIRLQIFLLLQYLQASLGIFFHERSHVVLNADVKDQKTFGFSLAYQHGKHSYLVTGAPHSSLTGKVFQCPLDEVLTKKQINCGEATIDVEHLAPYSRALEPDLKLNLGYSVSANDDYFFTCAPLWPKTVNTLSYSIGTCFVYNGTAQRYTGFAETLGGNKSVPSRIHGGNGWRTLMDQENEMLLIAKVASDAELTHVNSSDPLQHVTSMMYAPNNEKSRQKNAIHFNKYRNLGMSLAAGKFFRHNETVYAISALRKDTNKGTVQFLFTKYSKSENITKLYLLKTRNAPVIIKDDSVGSMFGAAMCSATLNLDLVSEVVVGAPAQENKEEGVYEAGAVHIYLGGDEHHINEEIRHRVIFGNKESSRFGTAIAVNDIDGDYLSELFISAPYEDFGVGALYILCGHEVFKKLMNTVGFEKISMSQLQRTQRISNSEFKTFGYSLQVIPDIDGNGCDELAAGSPGSQNIMLLRCLPSVNVTIEANHIGNQTVVRDMNFTVLVCISVEDSRNRSFPLTLTVTNEVKGEGAYIEAPQTRYSETIVGTSTGEKKCEEIIVRLMDNELGTYFFHSNVELDEASIINTNDLVSTRAVLSPYSQLQADETVMRQCKGSDCEPNLSMNLTWSGGTIHEDNGSYSYELGSSELLTAKLVITNTGNSSFESCAMVRVDGATVVKLGCSEVNKQYKCYMPMPLRRNAEYPINIKLNMTQLTNEYHDIEVHVILHDFCNRPKRIEDTDKKFLMKKIFNPKDVVLTGSSNERRISDTEVQDQRELTTSDAHEYWIENKGDVTWMDIKAEVNILVQPFISSYRVSSPLGECLNEELPGKMVYECFFNLAPKSKFKIIASTDIIKDKILENLKDEKLTVQSSLQLSDLLPSQKEEKQLKLSTVITFQKDQSLAQNKNLIIFLGILGAAIALAILIFVLYKMKFFHREKKTQLKELKQEHVRKQSVKRSMSQSNDGVEGITE